MPNPRMLDHPPAHRRPASSSSLVAQLILISAQVQSKAGVPVLEAVTFGVFSRVQGRHLGVVDGMRTCLGQLRRAARRAGGERGAAASRWPSSRCACRSSARWPTRAVQLQELLSLRTSTALPTLAAEVIAGNPNPGMLTVTINRGAPTACRRTWRSSPPKGIVGRDCRTAGGRTRRGCSCSSTANAAAGALHRASACRRDGRRRRPRSAAVRWSSCRTWRTSSRGHRRGVGRRRHLSEGVSDRPGREVRARVRAVSSDHRAARRGFLEPRGSARRARARRDRRPDDRGPRRRAAGSAK